MGNLYSHIVFQPPDPPLYTDEGGTFSFNYKKSVESLLNPFNEDKIIEHPLIYIKTSRDNMIACAFFPHRDATHTILFSHVSFRSF